MAIPEFFPNFAPSNKTFKIMAITVRIGLGRSRSGKILDRDTQWHSIHDEESWKHCVHEWSLKKNSGKPMFISRNGRAYKPLSGVELLELKNEVINK